MIIRPTYGDALSMMMRFGVKGSHNENYRKDTGGYDLKFELIYAIPDMALIENFYLATNSIDEDSHLPVFTGPSGKDDAGLRDFIKRLKERNFSGSIILEQWTDPPSLLNQARKKLKRMFEAKGFVFEVL